MKPGLYMIPIIRYLVDFRCGFFFPLQKIIELQRWPAQNPRFPNTNNNMSHYSFGKL